MGTSHQDDILRSLRRMTRAIDLYSRRLASEVGLTVPQLVCLGALQSGGAATPTSLAEQVSLSKGTVTGIVDRLERAGLMRRERTAKDRRVVTLVLTDAGRQVVERAPSPLHDRLSDRLDELPEENRQVISAVLRQVVRMMEAEDLDASPRLATGPVTAASGDIEEFLET